MSSIVDLPAPLGPTTPSTSPAPTWKDTSVAVHHAAEPLGDAGHLAAARSRERLDLAGEGHLRGELVGHHDQVERVLPAVAWRATVRRSAGSWRRTAARRRPCPTRPRRPPCRRRGRPGRRRCRRSRSEPASCTAAAVTSNSAWAKPRGWVHWSPVSDSKASASSSALWPVSELVYGAVGVHHTSVARLSAMSPSASTEDGNSSALPIVATLGE